MDGDDWGNILLPELEDHSDALPSGRYKVTPEVLEAQFGSSTPRRKELWNHWETATNLLRSHIPVCAGWIGGSYLTTKDEPGDIDCVYIVDAAHIEAATDDVKRLLQAFASKDFLKTQLGLQLDTFVLNWHASATPRRSNPDVRYYHEMRGYWDDLWSKMRSGAQGDDPTRLDAHPRRGYVEVILDGYSESGSFRTD